MNGWKYYSCMLLSGLAIFTVFLLGSGYLMLQFGYRPSDELFYELEELLIVLLGALTFAIAIALRNVLRIIEYNREKTDRLVDLIENGKKKEE